jgi:hypothetical protein
MGLRVLESDSRGRWRDGQPSWDLTHQRKKNRNQDPGQNREPAAAHSGAGIYNAKGDLVTPASSLDLDI